MIKYGIGWWQTRLYWRLYRLMGYLMTPCLPMRIASWIDDNVLHRWCVLKFYDTWTLRLHIILGGKWRDMIYWDDDGGPDDRLS